MPLWELLWKPLPERMPSVTPRRLASRLREQARYLVSEAAGPQMSAQQVVDRRVRRGFVQALVREAYKATVALQDREHRRPAAFAEAWRRHVACSFSGTALLFILCATSSRPFARAASADSLSELSACRVSFIRSSRRRRARVTSVSNAA
jgi:hypothetical protein